MYHEIERKFLVAKMPSLKGITKVPQERYFIQRGTLFEEGIKKKGNVYEYESKFTLSKKEKTREKTRISKEEFDTLKIKSSHVLLRDSYSLSDNKPLISIKKYRGEYSGLVLAEVEFDSVEEMEEFKPLDWMGAEVTETKLGKDALVIDLSKEIVKKIVSDLEENFYHPADAGSFL